MLTTIDTPEEIQQYHAKLQEKIQDFLGPFQESMQQEPVHLEPTYSLLELNDPTYIYVKEGFFKLMREGRILRYFSEGDLFLADPDQTLIDIEIASDHGADVVHYNQDQVFDVLCANPSMLKKWLDIQEMDRQLTNIICALHMSDDPDADVDFKQFDAGEFIIREGDHSDAIFEMLGGEASVFAGKTKVGEITKGEIFGELSFLTDQQRTATVRAKTQCFVQETTREDFEALVQNRPHLMAEIARKLAYRIVGLNTKVQTQQARSRSGGPTLRKPIKIKRR